MTLEEAKVINGEMLAFAFKYQMGEDPEPFNPARTLPEMIEASEMVKAANKVPGAKTITMTCDDRLIAAIYAITHYPPAICCGEIEPIIAGSGRALVCVRVN